MYIYIHIYIYSIIYVNASAFINVLNVAVTDFVNNCRWYSTNARHKNTQGNLENM